MAGQTRRIAALPHLNSVSPRLETVRVAIRAEHERTAGLACPALAVEPVRLERERTVLRATPDGTKRVRITHLVS